MMSTSESGSQQVLLDAIKQLERDKMAVMKRELAKEREEGNEKLVKRMKLKKLPSSHSPSCDPATWDMVELPTCPVWQRAQTAGATS